MAEHPAIPVLRLALERLERGWCQGHMAQTATGRACAPWSRHAAQWCLNGATDDGDYATFDARHEALSQLFQTLLADGETERPVSWNDAPDRAKAEVTDLVRRTIARLTAEPAP